LKAQRKLEDPRKKDFSPSIIDFGEVRFIVARHFGFCYGVENAIEISYKALKENPDKKIYLLSQMIHNPDVNEDLTSNGIKFIQDTDGSQLIPWSEINAEDVVIIPAFGTTVEIESILKKIGVNVASYNTTCPFVEKVWNRSEKLGLDKHTVIIHGKYNHEETRATFSRSAQNAPVLIIKDIKEAAIIQQFVKKEISSEQFLSFFQGKYTEGFDPTIDLTKIGVVNQTTMLATETQEITDYLRKTMIEKYGIEHIKEHIADTRDTLCYATNDNQSATFGLLEKDADFALVIGGYNSSNTTHLVELLESKFPTYFIRSKDELISTELIEHFNIHSKTLEKTTHYIPNKTSPLDIIVTSGASCPDAMVDGVIQRLLDLLQISTTIEEAFSKI
jgi:4-hydroxy-3-methylbut-2-enyl diphosphate reductase